MPNNEQVARRIRKFAAAAQYLDTFKARTGKQVSTTTKTLTDGAGTDRVWVTPFDGRPAQAVYGAHMVSRVDIPVLVGRTVDGEYEIVKLLYGEAVATYGAGASRLVAPRAEPGSDNTPVIARRLKPGRLTTSDLGGLYVYIEPFQHPGGYYAGGDLLLTAPSTPSKKAWIAVYVDILTNTAASKQGTEYALAYPMTPTTAAEVLLPLTAAPVAAVVLKQGQTAITALVDLDRYTGSGTAVIDLGYWRTGVMYSFPTQPRVISIPYHIPTDHEAVWHGAVAVESTLTIDGEMIFAGA